MGPATIACLVRDTAGKPGNLPKWRRQSLRNRAVTAVLYCCGECGRAGMRGSPPRALVSCSLQMTHAAVLALHTLGLHSSGQKHLKQIIDQIIQQQQPPRDCTVVRLTHIEAHDRDSHILPSATS